jgi:hypothetical protein
LGYGIKVSIAKAEYLRASTTRLGIGRRSAAVRSGAYSSGIEGSFGRPAGFPLGPFKNSLAGSVSHLNSACEHLSDLIST